MVYLFENGAGITIRLYATRSGVVIPVGPRYFSLLVLRPPSFLFSDYCFLPGVKRPGRDVDYSPPSSAEVKNSWSYTSTSTV